MHRISEVNEFYHLMDREFKTLFLEDVCKRTGWKQSRFYTRLGGRSRWTELELSTVLDVYNKYKKAYIV